MKSKYTILSSRGLKMASVAFSATAAFAAFVVFFYYASPSGSANLFGLLTVSGLGLMAAIELKNSQARPERKQPVSIRPTLQREIRPGRQARQT